MLLTIPFELLVEIARRVPRDCGVLVRLSCRRLRDAFDGRRDPGPAPPVAEVAGPQVKRAKEPGKRETHLGRKHARMLSSLIGIGVLRFIRPKPQFQPPGTHPSARAALVAGAAAGSQAVVRLFRTGGECGRPYASYNLATVLTRARGAARREVFEWALESVESMGTDEVEALIARTSGPEAAELAERLQAYARRLAARRERAVEEMRDCSSRGQTALDLAVACRERWDAMGNDWQQIRARLDPSGTSNRSRATLDSPFAPLGSRR